MKNQTLLAMLICFASFSNAQNNYNEQWEKVSLLESEGLTKSALEKVEAINDLAKKDNNRQQLIKILLYKSKYWLILEEDAQLKVVNTFKSEAETEPNMVTKQLLQNMLATLYWQYFQQNRYRFYNRTKTAKKVSDDFRTWDLETLFAEIHFYFQQSLKNPELLQNEDLNNYQTLLIKAENSKRYRPTLLDLLSYNALSFYKTDENSITQPNYKFKLDKAEYFSSVSDFITIDITSKDSTSLQLHALKIYQKLLKAHSIDTQSYAKAHSNIERLNFVLNHSVLNTKEELFLKALRTELTKNKTHNVAYLYNYQIANMLSKKGSKYDAKTPNTDNLRWKLKEAIDLCNVLLKDVPDGESVQAINRLKSQILTPSLTIKTERIIPTKKHSRVLVTYKNLETLQFTIYKVSQKQLKDFNKLYQADKKGKFLSNLKTTKHFEKNLKSEDDYQQHSTELILPELANGLYLIKASTNNGSKVFSTAHIQVTNMAVVESSDNNKHYYQLINRINGTPITNANIEISYFKNRNKKGTQSLTTDKYGKFEFKKDYNYYRNVSIKAKYSDETAYFGSYYINRKLKPQNNNDQKFNTFLFTDRSIYRPGHIVYFKGITVKTKNDNSTVAENENVKATLHNANGETLSEYTFKTNTYGAFHGEFTLPASGLTGQFYIKTITQNGQSGYSYFSVEEYKRPKFKPEFETITESFKVNDSITVQGKAKAFAGSTISNAKVVYRVKRNVQYPEWYYWRRPNYHSNAQEIIYGESLTNAKGEFSIVFKAIPDETIPKATQPIFSYQITADITDINGETRTATTTVNVGYHAMTLNIVSPKKIDKTTKDDALQLMAKNLNYETITAKGSLKIYKLNPPKSVLRIRPWPAPDYQVIPEEQFKSLFPNEPYKDEHLATNWAKGKLVLDTDFNTKTDSVIKLKHIKKWASGKYIIEAKSKDKFGQLVTTKTIIDVFSNTDKTVADNTLFTAHLDKESYTSGDIASLTIGSAAKNITVAIDVEKNGTIINTQFIALSNSKQRINIPVYANDLGGFVVHYSFAAFNSYTSGEISINVPYPKTDLQIKTKTFRDKLQPGQDQTWSFTIKGPKGDKVAAELLASMYDASLDEFLPHQWQFNPLLKPIYRSRISKNIRQSFGTASFRQHFNFDTPKSYKLQAYDELNWFGLRFGDQYYYSNIRRQVQKPSSYTSKNKSDIKKGFIEGIVLSASDGLPLPGVNVIVKGTTNGTQTDFDGKFVIEASKGNNIEFSYVGMKSLYFTLNDDNYYIISLEDDSNALDEVIITGYSKRTKESFTSSALVIENSNMEMAPEENESTKTNNKENEVTIIKSQQDLDLIQIRKNLQETAFFYPNFQTDKNGNISFSFTTPEALTQWKLQLLAHTKTLESAVTQLEAITLKELMVMPNAPRFLRQGDALTMSAKISNLSNKSLTGTAQLLIEDATTGKDITEKLIGLSAAKTFFVEKANNTEVSWSLLIPDDIQAVQYKVIAQAENFSDGEQNVLPVLTNRMLVTETLPMWIGSNKTKTFTLNTLKNQTSTTLSNHKLTLEITSNPAWYAVQALPYLMEYPYDCNEQIFSRYYANALAQHIVTSNPKIEAVFKQWASTNSEALLSNLEKNQELKSLLVEETPWLRDAQSETEQKKRIAILFDFNTMKNQLQSAIQKLKNNQYNSGAWPWFNGGQDNRIITQHIVAGFGHLKQLGVISIEEIASDEKYHQMITRAIKYLDQEFIQEYKDLKKYNDKVDLDKDHLSNTQLHYLYIRSFFPEIKPSKDVQHIINYYKGQTQTYWLKRSLYAKALMALTTYRMNDKTTSGKILKSLVENSITSEELGMYWKENTNSWHWYQAPIETQALLIEAFSEAGSVIFNDTKKLEITDNLKIWLLKNKQTNRWKTTKATTEAVYALLLQGSSWLDVTQAVSAKVGKDLIDPSTINDVAVEAGTGYFKTSWNGSEIKPEQAKVTLTKKGDGIAWGAVYWQYFEDLDKITSASTPLKLSKTLFLKTNTDKGEVISEIKDNTQLQVGDLVRVRIELQCDQQMEFLHLKDMRASGLEPVNVLSQYKWQDGLGYYESTKDAATHFFIDYLPKGIYVFEYDLRVNNAGNMGNGITSIQSMYAPEFSSHSKGMRLKID